MNLKRGANRDVVLIGAYAIKFASFRNWRCFLCGLLSNMQERRFWKMLRDRRLCPVLLSDPIGLVVVMPKAEPYDHFEYRDKDWEGIPVENKRDSFGFYKGRIVAIDYG